MEKPITPKSSHLQLAFLGAIALTLGIVCLLDVVLVHRLPALTSISESATTGNRAGMLMPFALGCMFTFCFAYVGYCPSERVLMRIMAAGFSAAAMQVCASPYITEDRVGLLGLSPAVSNGVHAAGAIVGFGAMFLWVGFFLTRGAPNPTPQKMLRNEIYLSCATLMASGIVIFILGAVGVLGSYSVFIAEEFMLIPAGAAILVKSGLVLRDR